MLEKPVKRKRENAATVSGPRRAALLIPHRWKCRVTDSWVPASVARTNSSAGAKTDTQSHEQSRWIIHMEEAESVIKNLVENIPDSYTFTGTLCQTYRESVIKTLPKNLRTCYRFVQIYYFFVILSWNSCFDECIHFFQGAQNAQNILLRSSPFLLQHS